MIRKVLLAAFAALVLAAPARAQFVGYPGCTSGSVCLLANGSNAAPSHSFSGFPSSGMYYDTGNGAVAISQGGGLVARFNGTGVFPNVSILFASDNIFDIGASGATRPRNIYAGTNVVTSAGGGFLFSGGTAITSSVNGNLILSNGAGTSFGLLQFGGTTSSFSALKSNGTQVQVRLADDSGYAMLQTGNFQSAGSMALTTGGNLNWTGSTVLANPPGNGVLLWTKAAGGQPLVSGLPSCTSGNDGARAYVTDATASTFASAVAGGGGGHVPVYCDGSGTPAWKIG